MLKKIGLLPVVIVVVIIFLVVNITKEIPVEDPKKQPKPIKEPRKEETVVKTNPSSKQEIKVQERRGKYGAQFASKDGISEIKRLVANYDKRKTDFTADDLESVAYLINSLSMDNWEDAVNELKDSDILSKSNGLLYIELVNKIAEHDLDYALNMIASNQTNIAASGAAMQGLFVGLSDRDPDTLFTLLDEFDGELFKDWQELLSTTFDGNIPYHLRLSRESIKIMGAVALGGSGEVKNSLDILRKCTDQTALNNSMNNYINLVLASEGGAEELLKEAMTFDKDTFAGNEYLQKMFISSIVNLSTTEYQDLFKSEDFTQQMVDFVEKAGKNSPSMVTKLLGAWGEHDPKEALFWAEEQSNLSADTLDKSIKGLMASWAASDKDDFSIALSAGKIREEWKDYAFSELAKTEVDAGNFKKALEFNDKILDKDVRKNSVYKIYLQWRKDDKKAADAWFQNNIQGR